MTNAEARFNKIHIRKVYACLAVTCHMNSGLCSTAVGWAIAEVRVDTKKVDSQAEISPAGVRTLCVPITSPLLHHQH